MMSAIIGDELIQGGEGSPQALLFDGIWVVVPLNSCQVLGANAHASMTAYRMAIG